MDEDVAPVEELKQKMQSMGYNLGIGELYGGHFTIYPQFKKQEEAHAFATVSYRKSGKIEARELLAFTRVQNQVAIDNCLSTTLLFILYSLRWPS